MKVKMVRRIAVLLGIICIILIIVIAYLSTNILSGQNNRSTYNSYVSTHSHSNADYDALQSQVNDLNDTLNLGKYVVWINGTISNTVGYVETWKPTTAISYAGYVTVQVESLTGNNNTFVEMTYSSTDYNADFRQLVGTNGTEAFPILPTTNLEVNFGTSDGSAASETVIMAYIY